ncbi:MULTISPECIES: hypothetical protein [unclassified Microcoleus]|uniref:hypothetical protein n=1 Tax=unclassified Microcoleus TaxID=2642155 RepID=UPI002FD29EFE
MKTSSALAMLARHAGRLSSSSFAGMRTETGILDELDVIIECLNLNAVEFFVDEVRSAQQGRRLEQRGILPIA